jgi:ABC-type multidrug transport system fused ATPase/permease subunit
MLLKAFLAQKKSFLFLLLGLGLLVGALEGAFILCIKWALGGQVSLLGPNPLLGQALLQSGLAFLFLMGILVTLRSGVQILTSHFELKSVGLFLARIRRGILQATVMHAVPAYRDPWRRALATGLKDGIENLGQGLLAGFHCLSAAAQVLVLIPILFFFSWKLAALALIMAIPALLVSRLRTGTLAKAGKGWEGSQAELAKAVEDFSEGAETQVGNGRLSQAVSQMEGSLSRHASVCGNWEMAKAIFPPALEWFFFMVLAGLAGLVTTPSLRGFLGEGISFGLGGEKDIGYLGLLPFGALLLLLYRPIREWARYYPTSHLGNQAWIQLCHLEKNLQAYPLRESFACGETGNIQLKGIHFGYQASPFEKSAQPVFGALDLDLAPQEITWITGRNGSGKSTLLKLLAGIERAPSGDIFFPRVLLAWERPIGYLSQRAIIESDWLPWSREFKTASPDIWQSLNAILGIEAILRKSIDLGGLSGGERQRLCLARTFASPCGYLLLDEPTTWLSANDRESIIGDLLTLWRSQPLQSGYGNLAPRGACIVSHEPFLSEFCTRTIHLEALAERSSPIVIPV